MFIVMNSDIGNVDIFSIVFVIIPFPVSLVIHFMSVCLCDIIVNGKHLLNSLSYLIANML